MGFWRLRSWFYCCCCLFGSGGSCFMNTLIRLQFQFHDLILEMGDFLGCLEITLGWQTEALRHLLWNLSSNEYKSQLEEKSKWFSFAHFLIGTFLWLMLECHKSIYMLPPFTKISSKTILKFTWKCHQPLRNLKKNTQQNIIWL